MACGRRQRGAREWERRVLGEAGGDAGRRAGLRGKQDACEKQALRRLSETKTHCQGRQGEEEKEEKASRWEHADCVNHKRRLMVTATVTATLMPRIDARGRRGAHGSAPCISSFIHTQTPTEGHRLRGTTT